MIKPFESEKIPFKLECPIHYKIGNDLNPYYETKDGWEKMNSNYPRGKVYSYTPVTQWFGSNLVPFYKELGWLGHNGIDLRAKIGCCVYAMCAGTVESISKSWGAIWITTKQYTIDGQKTKFKVGYGHLSNILVEVGQVVEAGTFIGYSGNTGKYTTGPHLHTQVNPYYLNSRGRWYGDTTSGYSCGVDFRIVGTTIYYKRNMKHLSTNKSIVQGLLGKLVSGISEKNYKKLLAGDKKVEANIRKQMIKNVTNAPLAVLRVENHGKLMIEDEQDI